MTATVRRITPVRAGAALCVALTLLEGDQAEDRSMTVSVEDYAAMRFLHPYAKAAGRALDEEQILALDEAEGRFSAIEAGLRLLAYTDNTVSGLAAKLRAKGFSPSAAKSAAEALAERGYIDELAAVERLMKAELKRGRGPSRIIAAAREKRYGDAAMVHLRDELAEVDFAALCAIVIERKYGSLPTDQKERQKAAAALARQGFSWSEIREGERRLANG